MNVAQQLFILFSKAFEPVGNQDFKPVGVDVRAGPLETVQSVLGRDLLRLFSDPRQRSCLVSVVKKQKSDHHAQQHENAEVDKQQHRVAKCGQVVEPLSHLTVL